MRVEQIQAEVAIRRTAPSPIDVVEVVLVVAVADKGMSAGSRRPGIIDRTVFLQFLVDNLLPVRITIIITAQQADCLLLIAEIVDKCRNNIGRACTAGGGRIRHLDRLTTHQHQGRDRVNGCIVTFTVIVVVFHVVPVDSRTCRNGWERPFKGLSVDSTAAGIGGNLCRGIDRAPMVIHHLGHGRGHTTRNTGIAVFTNRENRALGIIRIVLIPATAQQRTDRFTRHCRCCPTPISRSICHLDIVLFKVLDAVGIFLQKGAHVFRHVLLVDIATVRVTENLLGAVVTADDDKATVVSNVEDVKLVLL